MSPVLSICIPAYNRPFWLERALRSTATTETLLASEIEIVVTDDSTTNECEITTKRVLDNWSGKWSYIRNSGTLGMTGNWNEGVRRAKGQYVLVLHDDDFLLENGLGKIVETLQHRSTDYKTLLFGVNVVSDRGNILRSQLPEKTIWLDPTTAVHKLLSNSSFIRFPGMIFDRQLFLSSGGFNAHYGGPADVEMWLRLLSREGLFCVSKMTSAYTVHSNALTMGMFNEQTIRQLNQIFEDAKQTGLLSNQKLKQTKSDFFHQFILAGTFRNLRRRKFDAAKNVMKLFHAKELKELDISVKWLIPRLGFASICEILSLFSISKHQE